ncbi:MULTISPECIES: hypothetical protein [Rhodococcus]|uniref:hypothetical protein n=1 Tax=Rhodococcus TaxID=1827 RepID=UPI002954913D|nr:MULTISPECIES: hypothetical protein [Rhodococcus]MDV7244513.1 hypothetical protein [Rhodococcus oxybenzonivorans]MDV7274244.1 hypothetical protein [Rhodococcus oxybenzonivorans]MDV7337870.1 hypothetical protein [Rhodococcus oxybenzonivorans]MDV7345194.1 hypothetical protein [Rhodococcus oxybenzonivorans]MDV8028883.1 hypothetical protein [Rhodococcus sp. IEGM 27]
MSDLDSTLADVPHTERARVLVDHHSRLADEFVAEFERGLMSHTQAIHSVHPQHD